MKKFIGINLKYARIAKCLTVEDLAQKLEITRQAVYNYENSIRIPTQDILWKMEKLLDKPQLYFFKPLNNHFKKNASVSFICF